MDDATKDALSARFRALLDRPETGTGTDDHGPESAGPESADDESADLYRLFVELAALRSEVRTESRIVKEALDQFRGLFEPLKSSHGLLDQEVRRARAAVQDEGDRVLRPLLLDLLELRDRMAAGLRVTPAEPPRWWRRWGRAKCETSGDDAWRQGLKMSLDRLDRLLQDRGVSAIAVVGAPFDPAVARAVGTATEANHPHGQVLAEARTGFRWRGAVLRVADVVVNKNAVVNKSEQEELAP